MALFDDDEERRVEEEEEEEEDLFEIDIPEAGDVSLDESESNEGLEIIGGEREGWRGDSDITMAMDDATEALGQGRRYDTQPQRDSGWRDRPELTGAIDEIRRAGGQGPLYASDEEALSVEESPGGWRSRPELTGAINELSAARGDRPLYGQEQTGQPMGAMREAEPPRQAMNRALDGVGGAPSGPQAGFEVVAGEREGWRANPELRALSDRNRELMGLSPLYADDGPPIASAPPASRLEPEPEPEGRVRYDAQETVSDEPFSIRDLPAGPPSVDAASPAATRAARQNNERMRRTTAGSFDVTPEMIDQDPRDVARAQGIDLARPSRPSPPAPLVPPAPPAEEVEEVEEVAVQAQEPPPARDRGRPPARPSRAREQLGDPSASPREVVETGAGLARGPREQLREDIAELERLRQEPDRTGRDVGRVFQRIVNAIGRGMQVAGGQRPGPNLMARRFAAEDARDERERARRMGARQDILRRRMAADERAAARGERRAERAEDRSARQRERVEDRSFRRGEGEANREVQRERLAQQARTAAARQATQNWTAKQAADARQTSLAETERHNRRREDIAEMGPQRRRGRRGRSGAGGGRGRTTSGAERMSYAEAIEAARSMTSETPPEQRRRVRESLGHWVENARDTRMRATALEAIERLPAGEGGARRPPVGRPIVRGVYQVRDEYGRVPEIDSEDAAAHLANARTMNRTLNELEAIADEAERIIENHPGGVVGAQFTAEMRELADRQAQTMAVFEADFSESAGVLREPDYPRLRQRMPQPIPTDFASAFESVRSLRNPVERARSMISDHRRRANSQLDTWIEEYSLDPSATRDFVSRPPARQGRRQSARQPSAQRQPRRNGRSALRDVVQRGRRQGESDENIRQALEGRGVPADLIDEAFQ